jgi:predicted RNA binding protein YcfA (HicA-like mRNA interferase family)
VPPRRLPLLEVVRRLKAAGFGVVSQRGSHAKLRKWAAGTVLTTIAPRHDEIAVGLLRALLRQAHLTWDEFDRL